MRKLVDALPPALELRSDRYGVDPTLRALFASREHLEEVIGSSRSLLEFVRGHTGPVPSTIFCGFGVEYEVRKVLGMELQGELMEREVAALEAARKYDAGEPCGAEANAAKYLGAEAALKACTNAVKTHGGMGYAKEFHVERLLREVMIPVLAPVSQQMILNFVSERVLGLPKSY